MARRTLILCNPAAGRGRARRVLPRVLEFFAGEGRLADSWNSNNTAHLRELGEQAVHAGYSEIVALGGDGTFHHVAESTFGHGVTLGFLPAGSGNDIPSGLGIPADALAAAKMYLRTAPRAIDVLRVRFADGSTALCVGSGGMGLDAEAACLANGPLGGLPGAARYIAGALWTYLRFAPVSLEAEIDGAPWKGKVLLAAAANVPNYGGGVRIAPAAKANDGAMDLTFIFPVRWTRILPVISAMLRTGELRPEEIERRRARRATFRTERPVWFQADGEVVGKTPLETEVLPGALCVVAPQSG